MSIRSLRSALHNNHALRESIDANISDIWKEVVYFLNPIEVIMFARTAWNNMAFVVKLLKDRQSEVIYSFLMKCAECGQYGYNHRCDDSQEGCLTRRRRVIWMIVATSAGPIKSNYCVQHTPITSYQYLEDWKVVRFFLQPKDGILLDLIGNTSLEFTFEIPWPVNNASNTSSLCKVSVVHYNLKDSVEEIQEPKEIFNSMIHWKHNAYTDDEIIEKLILK